MKASRLALIVEHACLNQRRKSDRDVFRFIVGVQHRLANHSSPLEVLAGGIVGVLLGTGMSAQLKFEN